MCFETQHVGVGKGASESLCARALPETRPSAALPVHHGSQAALGAAADKLLGAYLGVALVYIPVLLPK